MSKSNSTIVEYVRRDFRVDWRYNIFYKPALRLFDYSICHSHPTTSVLRFSSIFRFLIFHVLVFVFHFLFFVFNSFSFCFSFFGLSFSIFGLCFLCTSTISLVRPGSLRSSSSFCVQVPSIRSKKLLDDRSFNLLNLLQHCGKISEIKKLPIPYFV